MKTAAALVKQAQSWLGYKEANGSHQRILDVYNAYRPLPRGYKMKPADAWCAAFVSACAIKTGMTDIIPPECGCSKMVLLFKALGEWQENEAVTPAPGWVVFYDWSDVGIGDDTSAPDHVGIVQSVENGVIKVIEGNYSNAVGIRAIKVNSRTLRGYGVPRFDTEAAPAGPDPAPSTVYTVQSGDYLGKIAKKYGVTVDALVEANRGKFPTITRSFIRTGWKLTIPGKAAESFKPYTAKVTTRNGLNVRKDPTTAAGKLGALTFGSTVTVTAEDPTHEWGQITYGAQRGWICLLYTAKA